MRAPRTVIKEGARARSTGNFPRATPRPRGDALTRGGFSQQLAEKGLGRDNDWLPVREAVRLLVRKIEHDLKGVFGTGLRLEVGEGR